MRDEISLSLLIDCLSSLASHKEICTLQSFHAAVRHYLFVRVRLKMKTGRQCQLDRGILRCHGVVQQNNGFGTNELGVHGLSGLLVIAAESWA